MSESEISFLITRYVSAQYHIIIGASSTASARKVG